MNIKMVDLQGQYLRIKTEIDAAIQEVLMSTAFIQGPQVKQFAEKLSAYHQGAHVVPCANGTDALQVAMMALGLKPGDEVLLPVHTYVATAEVIALLGLTPVFVDVEENTFNLDARQLKDKITEKTKAVVPVHLYGQCADMTPLLKIAQQHNLFVIEDVAQAIGARYTFSNGEVKVAGTIGHVGSTSFFPSKNLGAYGDAGALVTTDAELAQKLQMICNHGQRVKYHHDIIGVNSRLDTLQAAILTVKLKYLDDYTTRRNRVAAFYDEHLKNVPFVKTPFRAPYSTHVFHQYTLCVNGVDRDALKKYLEAKGIPTMIYYPVPLHFQPAYRQPGVNEGAFPVAEKFAKTVLSLPIHTEMTDDELLYICDSIQRFNG